MTAHPVIRVLHDVGAAAWFGGSLAGAVGLNGAAAQLDDPRERARISTAGWSRWAPVAGAAVVAHTVGAVGLTVTDSPRIAAQPGVARSSAVKAAVTAAGLGVSAWSLALHRTMAAAGTVPVAGATEPGATTRPDVARTQRRLEVVQWLNPLLAGAVIGTASWQSEQQRAAQVAPGVLRRVTGSLPTGALPVLGVAAVALAARRRSRQPQVEEYPTPPLVERPGPPPPVVDLTAGEPRTDATPPTAG